MSQDADTDTTTSAEAHDDGPRPDVAVEAPGRPELYIAAAFAGAFVFARILKRIAE